MGSASAPLLHRLFGAAGLSSDVADARAHLQRRVALLLLVIFLIVLPFALVFRSTTIAGGPVDPLGPNAIGLDLMLVALFAAWLFCRRGERSEAVLHGIEGTGIVALASANAVISHYLPIEAGPDLIGLLGVSSILTLRAALVPSTAMRTLLVGVLSVAPLIALAILRLPLIPVQESLSNDVYAVRTPMWGFSAITITTVTSHVIYGLQAKAQVAWQLGQYALEEKIGEGGMGRVYRGTHVMLRRPTAVKLLPPERSSEEAIARFEREVVQTSRLSHPNTVAIYDYGRTPDGLFYYAMEYLEGFSLEELLRDGPQPPARVVHLLQQATASLVEAHDAGLIHRDVKPGNLMVTRRGGIDDFLKVLDFGLVKELSGSDTANVTNHEVLTGTPHYLAPEAATAPEKLDGRADLYALGAVGYALLTSRPVFDGATVVEVVSKHLHEKPRPPSELVEVDDELERIVLRCLEKRPEDRFGSARELLEALDARTGPRWSTSDAAQWWLSRAPQLEQQRQQLHADAETDSGTRGMTVDIALSDRRPAAAPR